MDTIATDGVAWAIGSSRLLLDNTVVDDRYVDFRVTEFCTTTYVQGSPVSVRFIVTETAKEEEVDRPYEFGWSHEFSYVVEGDDEIRVERSKRDVCSAAQEFVDVVECRLEELRGRAPAKGSGQAASFRLTEQQPAHAIH